MSILSVTTVVYENVKARDRLGGTDTCHDKFNGTCFFGLKANLNRIANSYTVCFVSDLRFYTPTHLKKI